MLCFILRFQNNLFALSMKVNPEFYKVSNIFIKNRNSYSFSVVDCKVWNELTRKTIVKNASHHKLRFPTISSFPSRCITQHGSPRLALASGKNPKRFDSGQVASVGQTSAANHSLPLASVSRTEGKSQLRR